MTSDPLRMHQPDLFFTLKAGQVIANCPRRRFQRGPSLRTGAQAGSRRGKQPKAPPGGQHTEATATHMVFAGQLLILAEKQEPYQFRPAPTPNGPGDASAEDKREVAAGCFLLRL